MRIQHNIAAMNSYRNFSANNTSLNKNLEKLSTGYKINRAGDDAAGLAISEKMRAQITGLEGATKNSKDGISLIQTAEGALTEVHSMLNRMTTLAEQSANGTYQNELDREQLQKEVDALKSEIDRIADSTNFNGLKLLDGSLSDKFETTKTLDSPITGISTTDFAAKGASDAVAIDEESIVVRESARPTQQNAKFTVDLNAASFGADVEANDYLKLNVGGAELSLKVVADSATKGQINLSDITNAATLASKFADAGKYLASAPAEAKIVSNAQQGDDTNTWTTAINGASTSATDGQANQYVNIEGHSYKMSYSGSGTKITFEQVDLMTTGTADLNPKFNVELSANSQADFKGTEREVSQQPNERVQVTQSGLSVGSSHQAEVKLKIDFSKLKDGDKLTAGDHTYVFKIGENSQTTADTAEGESLVDLHEIMKASADLTDASKQAQAMVKITDEMAHASDTGYVGPSTAWTIGNAGVTGGIGTLTFQSLSTYDEDTNGNAKLIGKNTTYTGATGQDKDDVARMDSEANIAKQFFVESKQVDATTSFDVDVTKIKAGDSFTVDGTTFEFTDGATSSISGGVAIDLSSLGVANGLLASQRSQVLSSMKTAIDGALKVTDSTGSSVPKYTFTSNGSKITLTSNDDNSTTSTFENRVSASITTPTETTYGEGLVLQIGDTAETFNKLTVSIEDMHTSSLGIGDLDISTQEGAAGALDKIKNAINAVSDTRGNMGALQNRLEHTINNLGVMRENIQNAESVIRDTDVAEEMMAYTKNNILNQSAQAMLAQANQLPQGVLQLLG